MSQRDWLAARSPSRLWDVGPAREWASPRQIRLWECACARRLWDHMPDKRSRRAIEVAELYADGRATDDDLETAYYEASEATDRYAGRERGRSHVLSWAANAAYLAADADLPSDPGIVAYHVAMAFRFLARLQPPADRLGPDAQDHEGGPRADAAENAADLVNADLLREIIGNPFRLAKVKPAWLTSDVLALARGIYEERAFDRMPILADALQDAGCDHADILAHCRDEKQVHVRGCWVIDLLLRK